MAFFVNSVTSVAKAVNKTKSSVSDQLFGQVTDEKQQQECHKHVSKDKRKQRKGEYIFRFAGSTSHWMVLIYHKCNKQTGYIFHYVGSGVQIDENECMRKNDYKEHIILTRTFEDILLWANGYGKKYPTYNRMDTNCRKFSIRLAEYCNIPIFEIDGQKSMGIKVSSQYYSLQDSKNDAIDASKDLTHGKIVTATGKLTKSTFKNSAKIAVATGNTVIDGTKSIFQ